MLSGLCLKIFKLPNIEIKRLPYDGVHTFPSLATGAQDVRGRPPKVALRLWFLQYFAYFVEAARRGPGPPGNQIFELILRKGGREGRWSSWEP